MFEFAKEMYFDEKAFGNRSFWDNFLIRLLKSPAVRAGCLQKSKPKRFYEIFSNPNEHFDRKKLLQVK